MPAVTPAKTWQPTYGASLPAQNILFVTSSNDHKRLLLLIKQILTGFPSAPWVVQKSSDGAANAGAGDFISTISHLVWAAAGSNHSWFTIRQTGLGATAEILFDCSNASALSATIKFAPGGFDTGGTLTNAPTASGASCTLLSNTTWLSGNAAPTGRLSVLQSTDGHCTRVLWMRNGVAEGIWMFEKMASLAAPASDFGGSCPFFGYAVGANAATVAAYSSQLDGRGVNGGAGSTKPQIIIGSTAGNAGLAVDNFFTRSTASRVYTQHPLTRGFDASIAAVEGVTTVGVRALWGLLQDFWVTTSSYTNDGPRVNVRLGEHMDVSPGDYGLVNVNGLLMPWPHGAPMLLA